MKSTQVYWLRWIAVLPGALIGGFLWTFPLHWILIGTLEHGETFSDVNIRPIEYALTPLIINIGFTCTAYAIAPSRKLWATMTFTYLWWLATLSFLIYWSSNSDVELTFEYRFLLGVLDAVIGIWISWGKSKEEPTRGTPYTFSTNEVPTLGETASAAVSLETNDTPILGKPDESVCMTLSMLTLLAPLGAVVILGGLAVRAFSHTWTLFIIGLSMVALGIAVFTSFYVYMVRMLNREPLQSTETKEARGETNQEHRPSYGDPDKHSGD